MSEPSRRTLVLLAGGLGTRLRPVTGDAPKVSADVAGRPMLHFMLDFWFARGAERIILSLGYHADAVIESAAAWLGPQDAVSFVVEPSPRGTGGALRFALPFLPEHFLVANADTAVDVRLEAIDRIAERQQWDALLLASSVAAGADADCIDVDAARRVRGFLGRHGKAPGIAYAGVARVSRAMVAELAPEVTLSFESDLLVQAIRAGRRVGVLRTDRPFHDLGTPDRLATFVRNLGAVSTTPESS